MRWLIVTSLVCLSPLFAQEDALREALRDRDQEIQRLQRMLAEKDIEIAQLQRTLDDIRRILDMAPVAPVRPVEPGPRDPAPRDPLPSDSPTAAPPRTDVPEPGPEEGPPTTAPAGDIQPWLEDLSAKGDLTRERAIEALAAHGESVIPELEPLVTRGSLLARRSAVVLLGTIASPRGVSLLERALGDTDAKVRLRAVAALGEIEAQSASLVLIESIDDDDPAVKMTAIALLTERHGQDFDDDIDAWRDWAQANGLQ